MRARHPRTLPRVWLMTDERIADLDAAVARLPRGAGIVFRHYATPPGERRRLFAHLLRIAKAQGLVLVRAGKAPMRGEMGVHGRGRLDRPGIRTWPAHDRGEALAAERAGADLLFVSPVFATRSHPGTRALGPLRAGQIGRGLSMPLIALGGMNAQRYRKLKTLGFSGWAAIGAFASEPR